MSVSVNLYIFACVLQQAGKVNRQEANAKQNHDSNKINKVMEQIFVKKNNIKEQ